jgi:hypothetical protein
MAGPDPDSFQELIRSEPSDPAPSDAATWIEVYESLVAMMERQLEETRAFASRTPQAMQDYLSHENVAILEQEIEVFRSRLAQWMNAGAPEQ